MDFLMARSRSVDEVFFGFYGGESILEIDNIKECVAYAKQTYPGRLLKFTITTNGTLLTDDIIQFLDEHDFNVAISLDGPKELHDMNRIYSGGGGSFDDIMANVKHVKINYPKFFDKLSFMAVVAPGSDLSCVNSFFGADEVLTESQASMNTVNAYGSKDDVRYDDLFRISFEYHQAKVLLAELSLYDKRKLSKLFVTNMMPVRKFYFRLGKGVIVERYHPGGPCLPGVMRPFVNVNGNIYPCERVSEMSEAMCIGHIDTGFDMTKVESIMNVGQLTKSECLKCWNFHHCSLCVAACDGGGKLCGRERLSNCTGALAETEQRMRMVCMLLENEYDFEMPGGSHHA
jgi:uncharacterized protein